MRLTSGSVIERRYLKTVTDRTLVWYQVAFKNYQQTLPGDAPTLPTKATLQRFVIALRDPGHPAGDVLHLPRG